MGDGAGGQRWAINTLPKPCFPLGLLEGQTIGHGPWCWSCDTLTRLWVMVGRKRKSEQGEEEKGGKGRGDCL